MKKLTTNKREIGQNGFLMSETSYVVLSYDNDHMALVAKAEALPLNYNKVAPKWATGENYTVKKFTETLDTSEGVINLFQNNLTAFVWERTGSASRSHVVMATPEGGTK